MEVGILVLTNFTYTYGSLVSAKQCGQWLTFDPSSSEQLDELKFILDSSYMKRGFLYVDESIKEDFKNKEGIFTKASLVKPSEEGSESIVETSVETVDTVLSEEDRQAQLNNLSANALKKIAEDKSIDYINKAKAIEAILEIEYP